MSEDVLIRRDGRAGRITLNRPDALNALTWAMCTAIHDAIRHWQDDPGVDLVLIEGEGRAFCAGGDIREMYERGVAGDHDYGRRFWADEYRLNLALARYPKPVVSFLQGYTMGGGVGVGCHATHRVVDDTSRIAMPECGIGLVPDVGGSLLLARAPGRLGEYLGLTGTRMEAGGALLCGFADHYVPDGWEELKAALCSSGDPSGIDAAERRPPEAPLAAMIDFAAECFGADDLRGIVEALAASDDPEAGRALGRIDEISPLSAACAVELIHRVRQLDTVADALRLEYRFTSRASEHGDFVEGIRALIVDKDNAPRWKHDGPGAVTPEDVESMLCPPPGGDLMLDGRKDGEAVQ